MKLKGIAAALAISVLCPCVALADGIDIAGYLLRSPESESAAVNLLIVVLSMLFNYGLNFLVIGLPALRLGPVRLRQVALTLIELTILGQVADRIGAILALVLTIVLVNPFSASATSNGELPLLVLNFLFSAISIGLLVSIYTRNRWKLSKENSRSILVPAAILTNPAWALGLSTLVPTPVWIMLLFCLTILAYVAIVWMLPARQKHS